MSQLVVIDPRRTRAAQSRRLVPADPHRHRRRPGAGRDAHPGARRPADRAYLAEHTLGFDQVEHDVLPRFTPGSRRRDHRAVRSRRGASGRAVRCRAHAIHPHRFRHEPLRPWRPEPAHRGAAARRHRRLWPLRRRRDAGHRGVVRSELQRRAQAIRPGDDTHHQPPEARRGAAAMQPIRRSARCSSPPTIRR